MKLGWILNIGELWAGIGVKYETRADMYEQQIWLKSKDMSRENTGEQENELKASDE